jgi:hypothetical protein
MAALKFKGDHNKVAFLGSAKGHEVFEPMVEFLQRSKLSYALTHYPEVVYESLVTKFWEIAEERSVEGQPKEIVSIINGEECVVTESSVRAQLQLDDEDGEFDATREEIVQGLPNIGYQADGKKILYKNRFCPKWRFLVHTLLQCICPKSGGWDQFSSSLAFGIIYLSQGRTYNFSKYIFEAMLKNVKDTKYNFLMYPRFLQIILGIETNYKTHRPIAKLIAKL